VPDAQSAGKSATNAVASRRSGLTGLPQLWPFAALSASYFAHIGFFNPYLALWLQELGYGIVAISVLTSLQSATRLFAPYAWGVLSDRTGERVKLLRYSATVALLLTFGLWVDVLDLGLVYLSVVFLLLFTHTSAMMPMSEAAMAHLVSQGGNFDAHRYGRVRLWGSAGFLVTVFAAGAWFERFGMGHFAIWSTLTLLAVVVSAWVLPNLKEAHSQAQDAAVPATPIWPVLRQPKVAWFFASLFFHVLAHIGLYVYFSLYLDSLGYSKTWIGLMWAASVVVEIGWFFTQSRWLPRWSLGDWLVLCAAVMALRMGLTATGSALWGVLLLAQMLHAFTFAAHHTVCIALLSEYFAPTMRGRAQALFTVVGYGFPGVLGSLAGGFLTQQYGLSAIYWSSLAISLVAMACALKARHLRRPSA
jgi:MFS transporter, PPP family, 3-phenylpropionic acid transporter